MVQRRAAHRPGFRLRLAAAAEPGAGFPSAGLLLATGINNAQSIYAGALDLDALGWRQKATRS
jgi:hypothetical protein